MHIRINSASFLTLSVALCLAGCLNETDGGGTARVEGRITDAGGAQARSFGGEGTASAATLVRASAVAADGSLELLAEAQVNADATYALELPANEHGVVVEAVSASGEVLASAILESTGGPGERAIVTPIDSESSLEAAVYVQMIARGAAPGEANPIDLRARITSELALAVRIAHDRGDDVSAVVVALADAVRAAQETEVAMYGRAGTSISQADLFALEVSASAELSAELHGGASADAAYDAFFEALASAAAEAGATAEEQARAEAAASASFRASIEARLSAEGTAPMREAALLAAASIEARAQERATLRLMALGEAGADVRSRTAEAAADVRASISAAATADAAASAYAEFAAEIRGEAGVEGSILGAYLGVDLVTGASAQAAVEASATAAAQLDAAIDVAVAASIAASGAVDTRALAADVAAAYGAYFDAVAAQQATLAATSDEVRARTAVELLIVADGGFRS